MKAKTYNTVFFIAGLATLAYIVYRIGLFVIWKNLLQTGIWFLPVIFIWLVIYMLNAWALWEIIYEKDIPQTKLPFGVVLKVTIGGYAINYITPFIALGGEPYRILELKGKVGASKAASSVLLYNIMHVFSHIVFWMVSVICIILFMKPGTNVLIGCIAVFLVFFLLVCWIFAKHKKGLMIVTSTFLAKLPFIRTRMIAFNTSRNKNLLEIDEHIIQLFSRRIATFYSSLSLEFIARMIGCLEIYFIGLALNTDISLLDSFIISAGSSLFANLIFFSPMQLGAREGGFILALKSIGIAGSYGIFMSLVTRIRELFWILTGLILLKIKTK